MQMKRLAALALAALCLSSCESPKSPVSGQTSESTSTPRLRISVSLTADNQPLSKEWIFPASVSETTSKKGAFVRALSPAYLLPSLFIKEETYRSVGTSPIGFLYMQLPDGRGLALEASGFALDLGGNGQPSETKRRSIGQTSYFVTSYENPQTLLYYPSTIGANCPTTLKISDCKAVVTIARLPDGPAPKIETTTLVFVAAAATLYKVGDLHQYAELASLAESKTPLFATLHGETVRQLRPHSAKPAVIDLVYTGGNSWAFPGAATAAPGLSDVERTFRPKTMHRTSLTADDVTCCSQPFDSVRPASLSKVAGQVKYQGHVLSYDPAWRPNAIPALVDPGAGLVALMTPPQVRALRFPVKGP